MRKKRILMGMSSIGIFLFLIFGCVYLRKEHRAASAVLTQIAQTGPKKEALRMEVLASWMGISKAQAIPLATFDVRKAEARLRQNPLIETVKLTIKNFETLLIDYTVRQPKALLADFENYAIDQNGFIFPLFPFFTPKKMTQLYFGMDSLEKYTGTPIEKKMVALAFSLLNQLKEKKYFPFFIFQIDLSQACASSLGRREIIVTLQKKEGEYHYLRLTKERYKEEIRRYGLIWDRFEGDLVFDLRIEGLAFIQKREDFFM